MKAVIASLLAAGAVAAIAIPASASAAAPWRTIDQRQVQLDRRIDVGVRNGSLTRREAVRLRGEFRDLRRLEAHYRIDGLSRRERADLDRRFDALSARIRFERHDRQDRHDRYDRHDRRYR